MSLKNTNLNNVQIVNRDTKLCLGTPSLLDPFPGMVSCNEADKFQRWDIRDAYGEYGLLKKSYQSDSTTEFPQNPNSTIIFNPTRTVDTFGYDIIPNSGSDTFDDKTVKFDRFGNLKIPYKPIIGNFNLNGWEDVTSQMIGGCINVSVDGKLSLKRNHPRPYNMDDGQWGELHCDSKWDILVDCAEPQMKNSICDRTTGKYKCKPGHYGNNCDFIDENSKDQSDAFDKFYSNCMAGISSTMSNKDNCIKYHKTQDWLPTTDITNPDFIFWDVINSDDYRHNGYLINNNVNLAKLDTANYSAYSARKQLTDTAIMGLTGDKDRLAADQKLRIMDKTNIYNKTANERDSIKLKLTDYTLSSDEPEVRAAQRTNAIRKASENAKILGFNNQIANLQSQLSELQKKDRATSLTIANLKATITKLSA